MSLRERSLCAAAGRRSVRVSWRFPADASRARCVGEPRRGGGARGHVGGAGRGQALQKLGSDQKPRGRTALAPS